MHVSFDWIITRLCFSKHKTPNLVYIFNLIFKIHVPLFFIWVITINRLIKIELDVIMLGVWQQQKRSGNSFVSEWAVENHFEKMHTMKKIPNMGINEIIFDCISVDSENFNCKLQSFLSWCKLSATWQFTAILRHKYKQFKLLTIKTPQGWKKKIGMSTRSS